MFDVPIVFQALSFAASYHADQRRKGANGEPYINHPIGVARLLAETCQEQDHILLCAALLHDTIEDTSATEEMLRETFGDEITDLVLDVTDDKSLPKAERKRLQVEHASALSPNARLLKLADKISNLRDLTHNPPKGWDLERIRAYFDWADAVAVRVRGINPALDAHYDRVAATKP